MRTVNLLLGASERRLNNLLEALVLDVCYNQAAVQCTRTMRADEFAREGCCPGFHLIIVSPDDLRPAASRREARVGIKDACDALRTIKNRCGTTIIAFSTSEEEDVSLWEAGADSVLRLPLNQEQLKTEVRRVLGISERIETTTEEETGVGISRWSLSEALSRGWQRLKSA